MKPNEQSLIQFYASIWGSRKHYSEVSGTWLGPEPKTFMFAHLIPKRQYPEWKFNPDNIVLLSYEEHNILDSWREERIRALGGKWPELLDRQARMKEEYMEEFGSKLRRK